MISADLPGVRVRFTSREGGVSTGPYASLNLGAHVGDDPEAVAVNRARVAETLRLGSWDRVRCGEQVHGARVATDEDPGGPADGQATARTGVPVCVLVADCLPVAVAGPRGVAMLHAGWRGLRDGVLEAGIAALGGGELHAVIGPGAGACCYEVGDEVRAAFGTAERTLDMKSIARERLRAGGVTTVHDVALCTLCDARFFSHRRDGGRTGRQAGIAWST